MQLIMSLAGDGTEVAANAGQKMEDCRGILAISQCTYPPDMEVASSIISATGSSGGCGGVHLLSEHRGDLDVRL